MAKHGKKSTNQNGMTNKKNKKNRRTITKKNPTSMHVVTLPVLGVVLLPKLNVEPPVVEGAGVLPKENVEPVDGLVVLPKLKDGVDEEGVADSQWNEESKTQREMKTLKKAK
jgi:hypothetical protein